MYTLFNPDHWRYERKFFVSALTKYQVESIVRLHPAMFSEIYHERTVNNLYFDSIGMTNYLDNLIGVSQRLKVRIRWYGKMFEAVEKPVLEIKIKSGYLGSKIAYPLDSISIRRDLSADALRHLFKDATSIPSIIKPYLVGLDCSLLNSYSRKYFQSADKRFRITIDSDMQFFHISPVTNTFCNRSVDHVNIILELKYDDNEDESAETITNHFPFRITKSSKYVTGIERLQI